MKSTNNTFQNFLFTTHPPLVLLGIGTKLIFFLKTTKGSFQKSCLGPPTEEVLLGIPSIWKLLDLPVAYTPYFKLSGVDWHKINILQSYPTWSFIDLWTVDPGWPGWKLLLHQHFCQKSVQKYFLDFWQKFRTHPFLSKSTKILFEFWPKI